MSTLGRKAMKKTLKRLKGDAFHAILDIVETSLSHDVLNAIEACIRYIAALQDYSYELDEEWDKLLKRVEKQAKQAKPIRKKTTYVT